MLHEFFEVLHEQQVKQASNRGLVDTLKRLPNDELRKLANGETKLAYGDGDVDDWLQKYKGTPLFEKAVSLEQQKLELEANEQAQRQQRKELMDQMAPEGMSDERDQLCLEKRVLDLELATSQEATAAGAGGPEQALEQQEGAGLEQAMAAHETEQAQKAAPPAQAAPAAAPGGKGMTVSVKQDANKPVPPDEKQAAFKAPGVLSSLTGSAARSAESAAKLLPDSQRLAREAAQLRGMTQDARATVGAGAAVGTGLGAGIAKKRNEAKEASEETAQKIAAVQELAREMAQQDMKLAASEPEGHHIRRAILGNPISAAIEAEPGQRGAAFGNATGHRLVSGLKGMGVGGALGAAAGGIAGGIKGRSLGAAGQGAALGGVLGSALGGGVGDVVGNHGAAASRIHAEHSKHKMAGIVDMGAKALGAVKPFAQTLGAGAKEVGGAFSQGGMKAGLGAIKDVGAITAKAHPLGTAALAGGAGLAAGKMLGGGQQR